MKGFIVLFLFSVHIINAQSDTYDFNLPEVPSSPAFILMGISPSNIESPQTLSDLEISLQNNTNNFTAIPKNYSLSISPFWLLRYKETPYSEFSSNDIEQNVLQSFQISVGVADNIDELIDQSRIGVGFKISLLRGEINKEIEQNYFDKLSDYNTSVQELQEIAEKKDSYIISLSQTKTNLAVNVREILSSGKKVDDDEVQALTREIDEIDQQISIRQEEISREIENSYIDKLKNKLKDIKLRREGIFMNIAGGWSWDSNNSFDHLKSYRGGVWLDAGWQGEKTNWIGVIRYQGHDGIITDVQQNSPEALSFSAFDFGLKLDYDVGNHASVNGEFMFRSIPNTEMESSHRAVINVAYNLTNDLMINLSYGKDFEGITQNGDNKVALLNFVLGVGQKKKIDLSR